ncbi:MAG: hypothetical protein RBR57_06205 [Candidatus Syntrophosphaera sp.]|jgi:ribosomal 30S subunit maturation factor RimM|nr:hypothetical protein [Candidatus Cloacimonadota bacterium]MCB5258128.1 hypothetical protein [Candidatus Cloacimonadota bacterium]MDD5624534.1 hypothetical protein [Candidatus Cloacimonadota bacterium]MDY0112494.1 hypothetical protein [Candidatus Syntrophosphaera sp.]
MQFSDLVGIGKLGGKEADGFYSVLVKSDYRPILLTIRDVYLIFNSDRVFFVTISEREESGRKLRIKFAEDGIDEERRKHREAIIAIPRQENKESFPESVLGYTASFEGNMVGKITGYFHNNAQYVLEITDNQNEEILIPWVEHFIGEIDSNKEELILLNMNELLDVK